MFELKYLSAWALVLGAVEVGGRADRLRRRLSHGNFYCSLDGFGYFTALL